ncbi:hypothetical protein [Microtetraspora malaysiensis]|nr:hypothetical protein [Microtetraspora malaysiensis]
MVEIQRRDLSDPEAPKNSGTAISAENDLGASYRLARHSQRFDQERDVHS